MNSSVDKKGKPVPNKSTLIISKSLGAFFDSREQELKDITNESLETNNDKLDDNFISVLKNTTEEWVVEKIDIYIEVKTFFNNYFNRMKILDRTIPFLEYYDRRLNPLLTKQFRAAKNEASSDDIRIYLEELENFIFSKCIKPFCNDIVYTDSIQHTEILASLSQECKDLEEKNNNLNSNLKRSKREINSLSQKSAENSMTVLSIFTGIVMVFFGGFSSLENAISGMALASPYRLAFTMILFGSILYNVIVMLFYLVGKLTRKSVTCECYNFLSRDDALKLVNGVLSDKSDSSIQNDEIEYEREERPKSCLDCIRKNNCVEICRAKHLIPYVYWGNAVLITMLIFVFCMYLFKGLVISEFSFLEFNGLIHDNIYGITSHQIIISLIFSTSFFLICCNLGKSKKTSYVIQKIIDEENSSKIAKSEEPKNLLKAAQNNNSSINENPVGTTGNLKNENADIKENDGEVVVDSNELQIVEESLNSNTVVEAQDVEQLDDAVLKDNRTKENENEPSDVSNDNLKNPT